MFCFIFLVSGYGARTFKGHRAESNGSNTKCAQYYVNLSIKQVTSILFLWIRHMLRKDANDANLSILLLYNI